MRRSRGVTGGVPGTWHEEVSGIDRASIAVTQVAPPGCCGRRHYHIGRTLVGLPSARPSRTITVS